MIFKKSKDLLLTSRRLIFRLFMFLIPTQLAFHFWPNWAYIFGVRIDYLSPAVFLTDIFLVSYLVLFLLGQFGQKKLFIKKRIWLYVLGSILFIVINTLQATNPMAAFFKWLKILELTVFCLAVIHDEELKLGDWIIKPLIYSTILFSLIGIFQFLLGKTLGGAFYLLGERTFDLSTPGIALVNILGNLHLRSYSTFPHPNSFAGYLGIILFLIYFLKNEDEKPILKLLALPLGLIAFVLTFSLGSLISLFFLVVLFFLLKSIKHVKLNNLARFLLFIILIASLLTPIVANKLFLKGDLFKSNIKDRLLLTEISGRELLTSPIVGVGVNNFIPVMPKVNNILKPFWFLQPVHNIFLLVFVETGMVGLIAFVYLFFYVLGQIHSQIKTPLVFSILFIFLTGFVDHYWLTLQQNLILLFLILGLSLRKEIK